MRFISISLFYLLASYQFANEVTLKIESSGRGIEYEVMNINNIDKIVLYKTEGNFKTDREYYVGMDCIGVFKKIKNNADLDLTCEFIDQENEKMWASLIRKTEDIDAGIGKMYIPGGTGKWEYLSSSLCTYAVKINKSFYFASTVCKVKKGAFDNFNNLYYEK